MNNGLLQRTLVGGTLVATIAIAAGASGSSATVSPKPTLTCNSDVTCSTVTQLGAGQAFLAQAAANNGSVGTTSNPSKTDGRPHSGVWGVDLSSDGGVLNVGVTGSSANGAGMFALSSHYVGLEVLGGNPAAPGASGTIPLVKAVPALAVTGGSHANGKPAPSLIDGCASGGPVPCTDSAAVFKVANNGSITVPSCTGCATAPTLTSTGRRVDAFASRVAMPTIEDVGEGHVSSGRGYVRIDPAFAETMDRARPYLVMLTPEGPSHGLYVAERSPSGFSVRENPGGASTLGFTYRIVAKPFDTAARRLPVVNDR